MSCNDCGFEGVTGKTHYIPADCFEYLRAERDELKRVSEIRKRLLTEYGKQVVDLRAEVERLKKDVELRNLYLQRAEQLHNSLELQVGEFLDLLDKASFDHGTCEPRINMACTACNAKDELDRKLSDYKKRITSGKRKCEDCGKELHPTETRKCGMCFVMR